MDKEPTSQDEKAPANPNKNNPLGQRVPSETVGGPSPNMEHNQSKELVEEVQKKADDLHEHPEKKEPHQKTQNEEERGDPWP